LAFFSGLGFSVSAFFSVLGFRVLAFFSGLVLSVLGFAFSFFSSSLLSSISFNLAKTRGSCFAASCHSSKYLGLSSVFFVVSYLVLFLFICAFNGNEVWRELARSRTQFLHAP